MRRVGGGPVTEHAAGWCLIYPFEGRLRDTQDGSSAVFLECNEESFCKQEFVSPWQTAPVVKYGQSLQAVTRGPPMELTS